MVKWSLAKSYKGGIVLLRGFRGCVVEIYLRKMLEDMDEVIGANAC